MSHQQPDAASEIKSLRRDLDAASDRTMLTQRELDRLRALLAESRAEHQVQIEAYMKSTAIAESNLAKAEAQLAMSKQRADKAEAEAREAWATQAQQATAVKDIRAEVANRMSTMMTALQEREEELHRAQYQSREATRLRERVAQLEKMISSRDDAITELTSKFGDLRAANDALVLELANVRSTVASAARAESIARSASLPPMHPPAVAPSPPPLPPPSPPASDPHILETAHIITQCREWTQETDRTVVSLEDLVENQFEALQDLRLVIERGVANVNAESLGSAAANLDRHRLAELRRTEQRRLEQQLAAVSDTASTAAIIKASMANAKFNFGKLRNTMQQIADYISSLRQYVDKYCGVVGIPAMFAKWDAFAKSRPEPLPMPAMQQQPPQSPMVQGGHTPPFAAPGSPTVANFQNEQLTAEVAELTKRLRKAESTVDELTDKLRGARLQHDAEKSALLEEHRVAVNDLRNAAMNERRELLREIDEAKAALTLSQRESEAALAAERREHANAIQAMDRERGGLAAELQKRIEALEEELRRSEEAALRNATAMQTAKDKRHALREELNRTRAECDMLRNAAGELKMDMDEAHKHIDRLEAELEAAKVALDFEMRQQDEAKLEVAAFGQWKRNASHVAAAAEAARMGLQAAGHSRSGSYAQQPLGVAPSIAAGDAVAGRIGVLPPRPAGGGGGGSRSNSMMSSNAALASTAVFVQRGAPAGPRQRSTPIGFGR